MKNPVKDRSHIAELKQKRTQFLAQIEEIKKREAQLWVEVEKLRNLPITASIIYDADEDTFRELQQERLDSLEHAHNRLSKLGRKKEELYDKEGDLFDFMHDSDINSIRGGGWNNSYIISVRLS